MSDPAGSKHISTSKNTRRKLILLLFTSFLLIDAVISSSSSSSSSTHSALIKSSCSTTPYPDLCYSTIADALDDQSSEEERALGPIFNNFKNFGKWATDKTLGAAEKKLKNMFTKVESVSKKVVKEKDRVEPINDCLQTMRDTLNDLREAQEDLNKSTTTTTADDMNILLSAAMTNWVTCLDGFSSNAADKKDREQINRANLIELYKMYGNLLAMSKNMKDTDSANEAAVLKGRNMREEEGGNQWTNWLSAGDRRLLQSKGVTPDVVVAADGSGNYKTVSEAVAAAPESSSKRYVIRIKAGVYRENVYVPKKKTNLMFLGDGRTATIITGSRNVVDNSTTFNSATVAVVGKGFLARDLTFRNIAGPSKEQAVALRVGADHSAFYRCGIIGYRATLYVHSKRQFYINCYIAGTVDFIFGNAAAVLQDCDIHARRPNAGQINTITYQGRPDKNQNTGIIIQKCRIDATKDLRPVKSSFKTFLGRPWKKHSRTVIMQSTIGDFIDPAGWHLKNGRSGNFTLNTLEYREHANTGAGAGTSERVKWGGYKVITNATEAQQYTPGRFIDGGSWLSSTPFPYSLGL